MALQLPTSVEVWVKSLSIQQCSATMTTNISTNDLILSFNLDVWGQHTANVGNEALEEVTISVFTFSFQIARNASILHRDVCI